MRKNAFENVLIWPNYKVKKHAIWKMPKIAFVTTIAQKIHLQKHVKMCENVRIIVFDCPCIALNCPRKKVILS